MPAGDEDAGQGQWEQGGRDGGQAGGQVPVPRVAAVLRAAAGQNVELHELPGDKYPSATGKTADALVDFQVWGRANQRRSRSDSESTAAFLGQEDRFDDYNCVLWLLMYLK